MSPRVPLFDLWPVNQPVLASGLFDLDDVVRTGEFIGGSAVSDFEDAWATFCGQGEAVGVASGLDALTIALRALDVGRGQEVIVPALTFAATLEAVVHAGAVPVLADVGDDGLLDPAAALAAVTGNTRAMIPVHLWGQLADMEGLQNIAPLVIEDAAQAHGAHRNGYGVGEFADAAAFSFYPTKPLGAWGDAGAIVTSTGYAASRARALRHHGQRARGPHLLTGYTSRLDALQALVLHAKLEHLPAWADQRAAAAARYLWDLERVGDLELPVVPPDTDPAWHLFVVRTEKPDALADHLAASGVGTGRHYPVPAHLEPAYASLGYRRGRFPTAERLAAHGLSLPLWAGITEEQIELVTGAVRSYFDGAA